jgi:hypothetical protein
MEIHMVFKHFLFMLSCLWMIFLRRFGGYILGEHIDYYDLAMQREETGGGVVYLTRKVIETLDIFPKNI